MTLFFLTLRMTFFFTALEYKWFKTSVELIHYFLKQDALTQSSLVSNISLRSSSLQALKSKHVKKPTSNSKSTKISTHIRTKLYEM